MKQYIIFALLVTISIQYVNAQNSSNQTETEKHGTLMKHKGEFYCYDETTTTKKEVLEAKEKNSIGETIYQNGPLGYLAEDDFEFAEELCKNMIEKGQFPRDNQGDKIELEGTLTLELEK